MATITWETDVSGDFADGANWNSGTVPGSGDIADINASGAYTVTSSEGEQVRNLEVASSATLSIIGGSTLEAGIGATVSNQLDVGASATVDIASGSTLELGAGTNDEEAISDTLAGSITIASGGQLETAMGAGVQFSGGGTITLAGATSTINIASEAFTSVGEETIQGAGLIESSGVYQGLAAANFTAGVIDGDQSSADLVAATGGTGPDGNFDGDAPDMLVGATIFEATAGGGLELLSNQGDLPLYVFPVNVIQAVGQGSHVDLDNVFVKGGLGTLATSGGGIIQTLSGGATLWDVSSSAAVLVNDATTLSIGDSLVNSGTVSLASTGDVTHLLLESWFDQGQGSNIRTITLDGDGGIVMSDDAENAITAVGSKDTLINDGNTISGAGQIGGGSKMSLTNGGVIDATGTNSLAVNVGAGKVTNQAKGFLEGSGSGGLSLAGGTFTDSGTVEALDGSSVTFGSGAVLTNNSGGTLTGGAWIVTDSGDGAALTLSGPAITTLAATVELSGANSTFDTGSTALESSLATIAPKGKLELLAGRGWSGSEALTDDGLLQLGGGAFSAPGLTVNAGGTVSGFGDVSGPVTNDGVVQAYRGTLDVSGDVSGSGTLKVWGGSTLIAGGTISASESVLFATGLHAALKLGDPSAFASTITNWALSDTIDLAGTDVTSAQISGDTLAIDIEGGDTLDYTLANPPTNVRIVLAGDGDGGTNLTLYKAPAPAVARLAQAMAAMPSPAPASAAHAAEAPAGHLALIAASRA